MLRCKKLRVGRTKQIVHHLSEMSLSEIHMSYLLQVYWINRMNRIGNMQSNLQLYSVSSEVVNRDEKKRIVSISRGARCKQNYNLVLISSFIPCITVSHYHYLLTLSIAMIWSISCLEARGMTSLLIKTNAVTQWSSARGVRPSNVDQSWEEGTMTLGLEHSDR